MYDTRDIANEMQISESTVRLWAKQFDVPGQRKGPRWAFDEQAVEVFRTIQKMKEGRHGMQTIRRCIAVTTREEPAHREQEAPAEATAPVQRMSILHEMRAMIDSSLEKQGSLAEKYAKAGYEIGKLEAEKEAMAKQLQAQAERIRELEARLSRPWWRFWGGRNAERR